MVDVGEMRDIFIEALTTVRVRFCYLRREPHVMSTPSAAGYSEPLGEGALGSERRRLASLPLIAWKESRHAAHTCSKPYRGDDSGVKKP